MKLNASVELHCSFIELSFRQDRLERRWDVKVIVTGDDRLPNRKFVEPGEAIYGL